MFKGKGRAVFDVILGVAILFIFVAYVVCAFMSIGSAHDHARPDLTGWFQGLQARSGAQCCDGSDGLSLDDPDWDMADNRYRVRLDGEWYDVPDSAVVDGRNRAEHAVVWPIREWDGTKGSWKIRCFLPGTMS